MQFVARLTDHPAIAGARSRSWAYKRQYRLDKAIRRALGARPGPLPDPLVADVCAGWGDASLAGGDGFVTTCLAEAARGTGPVLQCGAGLMTLLLGIVAERADTHLWTLEHDVHQANAVRSWLQQYEISKAHVIAAPPDIVEGCASYVVDYARLPANFALVVCEGSSAVPGSAQGVLTRVGEHIHPQGVILVHHAKRRRDVEFLAQWSKQAGASMVLKGKLEPFVKIAMRDPTPSGDHEAARVNTAFAHQHKRSPQDLRRRIEAESGPIPVRSDVRRAHT